MLTKLGNVRWYNEYYEEFEDAFVELEDYKVRAENSAGSITESTIVDGVFYFVDVDNEQIEGRSIVRLKTSSDTDKQIFITPKDSDISSLVIKHFGVLNNILEQEEITYSKLINEKYNKLINNSEINILMQNFIDKTPNQIFTDFQAFICFERLIYWCHTKGRLTLTTYQEYPHLMNFVSVIEGFEDEIIFEDIDKYYDDYFLKLTKIIEKKSLFKSPEELIFTTWKLLVENVKVYYYNSFNNEYNEYFEKELTLDEMILVYSNIDLINVNSVHDAAVFTYYLMYVDKFQNQNFLGCNSILVNKLLEVLKSKELNDFEASLMEVSPTAEIDISDVDLMNGHDFERFISHLFYKLGYKTTVTKGSGDQGIDVIIEKNGQKIGVQTKCYSSKVTNKAIQEVVAGISYYNLTKGIVVTNNYFTDSAIQLALSNGIILWDRNMLKEKLKDIRSK